MALLTSFVLQIGHVSNSDCTGSVLQIALVLCFKLVMSGTLMALLTVLCFRLVMSGSLMALLTSSLLGMKDSMICLRGITRLCANFLLLPLQGKISNTQVLAVHNCPDIPEYNLTDGLVVIAGVSVTWNVLSWFGGYEFKPRPGWTWGAWYFCPKSYLNQTYNLCVL